MDETIINCSTTHISRRPRRHYNPVMDVQAVIFDWGGTLTPWHDIDVSQLWHAVCTEHFDAGQAAELAAALDLAEREMWQLTESEHRSATLTAILERAGVSPTEALLASYTQAWAPHTYTDPDAEALLRYLRGRGIKVGVLSNTFWPRPWHEEIFRRDGILDLIDGAVYTSEIDWTKPHPEAFRAAMAAVGVTDPAACVFVGDRPFDDVHGAKSIGMRAVLIPNSTVPAFPASVPDAVVKSLADLRPLLDSW
jgi:putative hydrolase of the HAD superfamily